MPPIRRSLVIQSLKQHEGLRLKPYVDTQGKLTIGYGRNLEDKGMSRPEADMFLENDVTDGIREAMQAFPWLLEMDEARAAVVVELTTALGLTTWLEFKRAIAACAKKDYATAAREILDSNLPKPDQWGEARTVRLATQMETGKVQRAA